MSKDKLHPNVRAYVGCQGMPRQMPDVETWQEFSIIQENHTNRTCLIQVVCDGHVLQKEWVTMSMATQIKNDVKRANLVEPQIDTPK